VYIFSNCDIESGPGVGVKPRSLPRD